MRTDIVSCKDYVEIKKKELKEEIRHFNRKPVLAVIQIDNDQASNSYIKGKQKDCDEIGIEMRHVNIHSNIAEQKEVEGIIKVIVNSDADGIIIQLPIPDKYDLDRLQHLIPPEKDVDGFRRDSCFKPCTPKGIIDWMEYNNFEFKGKDCCVLGRSKIVGLPLTNMLIEKEQQLHAAIVRLRVHGTTLEMQIMLFLQLEFQTILIFQTSKISVNLL